MIPVKITIRLQKGAWGWYGPGPGVHSFPPGGTEVRSVVEIDKVAVAGVVPLAVTDAGDALQVACDGRPLQLSATAVLDPDKDFTVTVTRPVFPAANASAVGETAMVKSEPVLTPPWVTPVPVSRIIWGLLGALSVSVSDPALAPGAEGVKVTVIVQFEAGVVTWRGVVQVLA
jgi:hypothetical protein